MAELCEFTGQHLNSREETSVVCGVVWAFFDTEDEAIEPNPELGTRINLAVQSIEIFLIGSKEHRPL